MKAVKARITKSLPHMATMEACDNSGARIVKLISVKGHKTVRGRLSAAGVGDFVKVVVIEGKPDVRKQVFPAIIVRQRQPYRRKDGTRIKFEDNAAVILKDESGNPKGTMIKGPIAKEASERWPALSKVAKMIV
ncbi:50S ribosomal protein L14 [Candidatus Woesearchaeota archaeon CG10_big_fil_rev_8_21_14_0_10_30_7]|nr:MAG: 50S ribosomal protein L14 [Candidatus Woesearchaeota archaeon CG10_big_fil_rev_8_21_14_0_10_30_7]